MSALRLQDWTLVSDLEDIEISTVIYIEKFTITYMLGAREGSEEYNSLFAMT